MQKKSGGFGTYLVKIDVVVKRNNTSELGGPEASNGVSTDGKEYKCHVELKSLS